MNQSKINANSTGIGLRAPHFNVVLNEKPRLDWLEIHSENYFETDSAARHYLREIAAHYPLSFHGVGLSLGSNDDLSLSHLRQLKSLIDEFQPALISEHLSWSSIDGQYFNDLLPIPYTEESLSQFCEKVDRVQSYLGRTLLIENPTAYVQFKNPEMAEWDFLNALQAQTGCGLLLDLNNIYVNSFNHQSDVQNYLDSIHWPAVKEIHLAGFTCNQSSEGKILIDTHGSRVSDPVWALYRQACELTDAPTLIEWDTDIPELSVLQAEAQKAASIRAENKAAVRCA